MEGKWETERERERERERETWKAGESCPSSPVWTCTELSIPWAPRLSFWSCRLCMALLDGSSDESFGSGSPPQGRNLDLKERSERETQTPGPRGEETDCLSEAYQDMEGYMHSEASENWHLNWGGKRENERKEGDKGGEEEGWRGRISRGENKRD